MDSANKKKLAASAVLIVASIALLLGLTFAWFTDSVTNKGNRIQAGTLDVQLLKDGVDISGSSDPVFSHDAWEPGYSTGANLSVKNAGNLALKYELRFKPGDMSGSKGIENVIDVYVDENLVGTLNEFLTRDDAFDTGKLKADESNTKSVKLKMQETAGNDYQGVVATFDIVLVATQDAVESDGFGNTDYDKDAEYPTIVSSADELVAMAATGGNIELGADVALAESTTFAADTTLNLNGNTLTVGDGSKSISAAPGTTLAIEGDGGIEGGVFAETSAEAIINAGSDFKISSNASLGYAVYGSPDSKVTINGGSYTAVNKGGTGVICQIQSGVLSVSNAEINVGADSVSNTSGIYAGGTELNLTNVVVNAKYSRSVYLLNEAGTCTIEGGTFTTNEIAEGFRPNPTIQYKGSLSISNATINRVGNGILYNKLGATDIVNLSSSGLTFNPSEVDGYPAIAYRAY